MKGNHVKNIHSKKALLKQSHVKAYLLYLKHVSGTTALRKCKSYNTSRVNINCNGKYHSDSYYELWFQSPLEVCEGRLKPQSHVTL